jgi:uncharacterized protein
MHACWIAVIDKHRFVEDSVPIRNTILSAGAEISHLNRIPGKCFCAVATFLLLLVLAGCAGRDIYPAVDQALRIGNCNAAMTLMAENRSAYGRNAELLYLLDSAMVGLQCADYPLTQKHLQAAEQLAEKLWTESISRNVAALVTNDYTLPYSGEDYERVLIHLVSAIGYLQADQPDGALVEIRRLDSLLAMFADKYHADDVYKKDAFARYLSGMLHEADGAYDDAFIDYFHAAEIYGTQWRRYGTGPPDSLIHDLLRMAAVTDRMEQAHQVVPQGAGEHRRTTENNPHAGSVVLIVFSGEGPHKVQDMAVVPTPGGPIGVAFPRIVTGAVGCDSGTFQLAGETQVLEADLALVSDINQIALKTLEDRRGRIVAKAVARAVAKQVAIKSIVNTPKDKDKRGLEVMLNIANMLVLERADTRSWRTLPGRIRMARTMAPAGAYQVQLRLCGNQVYDLGHIEVAPGANRFLFLDTRFNRPH